MINGNNQWYQSALSDKQAFNGEFAVDNNLTPAKVGNKEITENGEYFAKDDNLDGYSSVKVDVSGGGGEIFEVNVTYDGETLIFDKTYSQISSAISNGNTIGGTFNYGEAFTINCIGATIETLDVGGEPEDMVFLFYEPYVQELYSISIGLSETGQKAMSTARYTLIG